MRLVSHRSGSARTYRAFACLAALSCACGGGDITPDASTIDAPPDVGNLEISWSIENAGTPLACDQVMGISVQVEAVPSLGGVGFPDAFVCAVGSGTTIAIPSSTYDVNLWLATTNSRELTQPVTFANVEVMQGQTASIGPVVFEVAPQGNVEFTVNANAAAGNCEAEANGGAEITEFAIDFLDANDACVPTTFTVAAGANRPGGSYVSDCLGARYPCIDTDQTIRAENVPSGAASLSIVGYRGVDACYRRAPQFAVPGNGLSTTLSPQVLTPEGPCVPAP